MADGEQVTSDPLPPADQRAPTAQSGELVLLDTTVAAGIKGKRRVAVTDRAFYDGGHTYHFQAVTAFSHQVTRVEGKTGRTLNFIYELFIATGDKPRRVYWSGGGEHERVVYDGVVGAFHRYVAPQIVTELVERMARGETVEMGSLRLTSQGIARRKLVRGENAPAPWSPRIKMAAQLAHLRVYDGDDYVGIVSLKTPNAVLLPALADVMQRRGAAS